MALTVSSIAFEEGAPIPRQYTCDGSNVSPPLKWSGMPAEAETLALIVDDPDAPRGTFVHWVLYDLPASTTGLDENVPPQPKPPSGGTQGTNDFRKIGYGGPCPPSGTHRYYFKLYALDTQLGLGEGATKADVLRAMDGHVLAEGQLMGTYKR